MDPRLESDERPDPTSGLAEAALSDVVIEIARLAVRLGAVQNSGASHDLT
jgi:hypothetical protein